MIRCGRSCPKKMKDVGWAGVDEVDKMWKDDFRSRKIVGTFLASVPFGKKRLASMPDRVTNTIRTENGNVMRRRSSTASVAISVRRTSGSRLCGNQV